MKIMTCSLQFSNAKPGLLNNRQVLRDLLYALTNEAGLTALEYTEHQFEPQGVSATLILAESHIAAHTWPELGEGYVTITTCKDYGSDFTSKATELVVESFGGNVHSVQELS